MLFDIRNVPFPNLAPTILYKAICVLRHNMDFVRRVQKEKLWQRFLSPASVERRRQLREERRKAGWYVEGDDGDDAPERPVHVQVWTAVKPVSESLLTGKFG